MELRATGNAFLITPNDSASLPGATTGGIYVGSTGTLQVTLTGGATIEFLAVPAGAIVPVIATKVWSTNTSAGSLIGLIA